MQIRPLAAALVALALQAAPAGVHAQTAARPAAGFAAYSTYGWATLRGGGSVGVEGVQRVRAEADRALAEKGYRQVHGAALRLVLDVTVRMDMQVAGGRGADAMHVFPRKTARVAIEASDARTGRAVWRGEASVPSGASGDAAVAEALAKLMAQVPPRG
jgi:hypothetical protein